MGMVERLAEQVGSIVGSPVDLERPADPSHGDYATNAAMQLAPQRRRPPRELAAEIAAQATALREVERVEVAGPGFVNLWLAPGWYGDLLAEILAQGRDYGAAMP